MTSILYTLADSAERRRCAEHILHRAPQGWSVVLGPPRLADSQRRQFHAICNDVARSGIEWRGQRWSPLAWKHLIIPSHAIAAGDHRVDLVESLEGGALIDVRESITTMDETRGASLIAYAKAWALEHGARLRDNRYP